MQRISAVLHGGQSYPFRLTARIIFIEKLLKAGKEVFVHIVACDKLAVVEPGAIIKEHLDAVHYQRLAVLVYSMTQFVLYFVEAVHDDLPFLGAEVQGLIGFIRKKV